MVVELETTSIEDQLDELERIVQKRKEKAEKRGKVFRDRPEVKKDRFNVPSDYKGARLSLPLSPDSIQAMVNSFRLDHSLHYKYAFNILSATRDAFVDNPTVAKVDTDMPAQCAE